MTEKERPGVIFYFELRPCLKRLSVEDKGRLFEIILDYAQYGEIPEPEGMVAIAWDFIKPRIDRDAERYEEIVENKRKAARKRWDKQEAEMQTDADGCSSMQVHPRASDALQTMPTTTTNSTTTTKTNSTTTPATISKPISKSRPTAGWQDAIDRRAVAGEMSFEDLRQQKLRMLSGMMGGG